MDQKLIRIRELIDEKERIDGELSQLIAGIEPTKRGRPRKERDQPDQQPDLHMENGHAPEPR